MKQYKITVLLLGLLLLAYSGVPDDSPVQTPAAPETEPEGAFADRSKVKDGIGSYDFGGAVFDIVLSTEQMEEPYLAESETGDLVNDAVFRRTLAIEERFNTELEHHDTGGNWNEVAEAVRKSVSAGDNAYDLGVAHTFIGLTGLMTAGSLYDWKGLPVVDMQREWWNSTAGEKLAVDNILLTASNDYIYQRPMVLFFNKDMTADFNLESPYALVKDGSWTWDKLTEMAKTVSADLDGNGIYDENDRYGYSIMLGWQAVTVIQSMGLSLTVRNDEGYPTFEPFTTDKMVSIFEKFYNLLYNGNQTLLPVWESYMGALGGYTPLFESGQVLFLHSNTELLRMFREIEIDFGMIPLPKYDAAQENHQVICDTQVLVVPADVTDPEFVGVICEALAAESYKTVVPAVYEVTFANKYLRDEESYDMFDIIRKGIVYEFGWTYGEGNEMIYALERLMVQKSTDVASFYAKNHERFEKQFAKVIDGVREVYGG
ncbi:MAG: extracellular solute-binding protein [Eubacteriales bacterium]|nr:extracellular solute-binding protein [Eubacteriales bacterium]